VDEGAQRALARLAARWDEFTDLRALADIALQRGGERQRLTGVLLARHPGSLRFEALSPFGQPYLLVTVHEGRLTAYDAAKHEALVGPATADTLARVLGLPLAPEDLVAVLAGRPAPPRDLRSAALLPPDVLGSSLELVTGDDRRRIWLDLETGVARQVELDGGRLTVRITFRREGEAPAGFDLDAVQADLSGSVTYRHTVLGGGIPAERFVLTLPKGAKIQDIR
jgi:outer membrane lipoprotein-sorting protein